MSDSLQPHGLKNTRLPCSSPTPGAYSNSCPSSQWYHPATSSSVIPFSSHLQSFPPSGSFPISQFFTSGGHSIGISASTSVLPMNIQDWFPLGLSGWSLCSSRDSQKSSLTVPHWWYSPMNLYLCIHLAGKSLWGQKESDTTEWQSKHKPIHPYNHQIKIWNISITLEISLMSL